MIKMMQPLSDKPVEIQDASPVPSPEAVQSPPPLAMRVENLFAGYGGGDVIRDISLDVFEHSVTAIIGPSGCGKSTFIRCLNRMHEVIPGAECRGGIRLGGRNVLAEDPVALRQAVGMVFQKPNPFPTMSIEQNVAAGLALNGIGDRTFLKTQVETSLKDAALWDEVKDRLDEPATGLSGGQQQRLCIARALAVEPKVLLLDEPCSALDPIATARIEELILKLKERLTIVIVTHNMQQAARVSEYTAFFLMGELVEFDKTKKIFTLPSDKRTEDYVTGRFG
jgi:phosphate transport system ATP-binding protein